MKFTLWVNGVRHNVPDDERDQFYTTVIGRKLIAIPEPSNPVDPWAIAVFADGRMVGHISRNTLQRAWSCLKGRNAKRLQVKVADTDRVMNALKVHLYIHHSKLADVKLDCNGMLDDWHYDGPMLRETKELFELDAMSDLLLDDLRERHPWDKEMQGCLTRVVELLHIDKSKELQQRLFEILQEMRKPRRGLKREAELLDHAMFRSAGDPYRQQAWDYWQEKGMDSTFRENVRLWYDKDAVKGLVESLPDCYRQAFRTPAQLLGLAAYQSLPRDQWMQLLSFAAAMDVAEGNGEGAMPTFSLSFNGPVNNVITHASQVITAPQECHD